MYKTNTKNSAKGVKSNNFYYYKVGRGKSYTVITILKKYQLKSQKLFCILGALIIILLIVS